MKFTIIKQQQYLIQFGKHLKSIRLKSNLSVSYIAKDCSISEQEIIQIEDGKIDIQIALVKKLADALEIEMHELFAFDTER